MFRTSEDSRDLMTKRGTTVLPYKDKMMTEISSDYLAS
jgi:hypothetical protein